MIKMSNERTAQRHELQESREARKRDKQCQTACANKLLMSQIQFQQELIKFMREQQHRPCDDPKQLLAYYVLVLLVTIVVLEYFLVV